MGVKKTYPKTFSQEMGNIVQGEVIQGATMVQKEETDTRMEGEQVPESAARYLNKYWFTFFFFYFFEELHQKANNYIYLGSPQLIKVGCSRGSCLPLSSRWGLLYGGRGYSFPGAIHPSITAWLGAPTGGDSSGYGWRCGFPEMVQFSAIFHIQPIFWTSPWSRRPFRTWSETLGHSTRAILSSFVLFRVRAANKSSVRSSQRKKDSWVRLEEKYFELRRRSQSRADNWKKKPVLSTFGSNFRHFSISRTRKISAADP